MTVTDLAPDFVIATDRAAHLGGGFPVQVHPPNPTTPFEVRRV